jgi:hypothetical protein
VEQSNKLYKCYKPGCNKADDSENPFLTQSEYDELIINGKLTCPENHEACGIQELKPEDYPKPPKDNKKLFLIGGGILVVLLIVGAVFMFTGKSKSVATTGLIKVVETVKGVVDSSKIVIPIKTEIETLQLLINEADLILSNKEYDKAKQKYQKILTIDPGNEHAKNQLLVIEKKLQPPPPPPPPGKISKTLNFPFGYYKGETINGLRDGQGTMFFTQRQLISPNDLKKRYAESGEKVSGTWVEGNIVNGKLFDKNGEQKETLYIGH